MIVEIFDQKTKDFISSLDRSTYAKTLRTTDLLGKFGNHLRMPYSKSLGSNIFELRVRGQKEVRLLYCFYNKKAFILHGFIKKTEKTPQKEILVAIRKFKLLTSR